MKLEPQSLSRREAFAAIHEVLYVIRQCLSLHVWVRDIRPLLIGNCGVSDMPESCKMIQDSLLESTLLFVRRLNEFFSAHPHESDGRALRVHQFGDFKHAGRFLTDDEYNELYMAVGRMSPEQSRQAKKFLLADDYVRRGLEKSALFLEFLLSSPEIRASARSVAEIRELLAELNEALTALAPDRPERQSRANQAEDGFRTTHAT